MTVIRPLDLADVPALTELVLTSREHLAPWEPARPERFYTEEGQREMVRLALAERHGGRMGPYVVTDERGRIAGRITLNNIVRGAGQYASVGYWLGAGFTGRGLATRAVAELSDLAFGKWQLHRLEAGTLAGRKAGRAWHVSRESVLAAKARQRSGTRIRRRPTNATAASDA